MSTRLPVGMEHHPDILELREHYERVTSTPLMQGIEAMAVCCGLFLAISPWVVGFAAFPAAGGFAGVTLSNLILGLAFAMLMGGYGSGFERTHARAYAGVAIGVWTMLAPWWTTGDQAVTRTIWTNLVTGGLMTCLCLGAIGLTLTGAAAMRGRGRG